MAKESSLPLVAICGRPNVGKSTLFNRIVGRQQAIVHKEEGVTRDRFYASVEWQELHWRIVDTGGIVERPTDPITHKVQEQIRIALEEATVIVFVVDGQQELTRVDYEVRDELYSLGKPVVVAVNKLDNERLATRVTDFYELGLGEPYPISAAHGLGVSRLVEAIVAHLTIPDETEAPTEARELTKVAVVGKPNVGKSSFVNALLNEERVIVTEIPGTTRDSIDIELRWKKRDYLLIDTAGLRKKAHIAKELDRFSVSRALGSIRRADVCLVMMDATEGLTEQDKRIMEYIHKRGTALVMVWTKWDLVQNEETRLKQIEEELDFKAPFLHYVPYLTISSVTRLRLFRTLEYVDRVAQAARHRIPTGELNRFLDTVTQKTAPPSRKGKQGKIYYATQIGIKPTKFLLFVNEKRLFHFSYLRFIENQLREKHGFEGVPIHLELREK